MAYFGLPFITYQINLFPTRLLIKLLSNQIIYRSQNKRNSPKFIEYSPNVDFVILTIWIMIHQIELNILNHLKIETFKQTAHLKISKFICQPKIRVHFVR